MAEDQGTFVQPKIVGYRQLTEADAAQMNEIKLLANQVGDKIQQLKQTEADQRWVAIAETQLQQGFMALVRSVAQPSSF